MNNKIRKYILITLSIIGVFLVVLGETYAYWILTRQQTGGATVLGQIV